MLYFDIAIIAGEIAGLVFSVEKNGWWKQFQYYTQCSNYILLAVTAVHLVCLLRKTVPVVVERCRYYAACLTTVTFVVTVCILIPWFGHPYFFLMETNGLFQHLVCPLLAVAGMPFVSGIRKKDSRIAVIPTAVYGIVLCILNYFRVLSGPYPFLKVHDQPWYMSILWFAAIGALAFGIAVGLRKLSGRKQGDSPESLRF